MKKLAFLIDEIDKTKELIRFAALLGKDINAKIHVLHVQNPQIHHSTQSTQGYMGVAGVPVPADAELLQKISDDIKEKVTGYIQEIEDELSGIPSIKFKSDIGDASIILQEKIKKNKYDIVLLQNHTEEDFWLRESVNMDVVRNVPCPVFIVPPDAKYQPLEKIIYATDYNKEDIATLKSIIKLLKSFDPEILALHISNDNEFKENLKSEGFASMLNEKTGSDRVSVKMISDKEEEDAVESLVSEAEKAKVNLIVVLKENRNFFKRLFKSSFTAELIKDIQLPVLVFHKKEK